MKLYVEELVPRLPPLAPEIEFLVFSNQGLNVQSSNATFAGVPERSAANGSIGEQFLYPRELARSGADLVHYMSVYAPRTCPLPHVYTIHDVIHLRFPHYFSWKVRPYYRLVVGPVARSAKLVFTDATATVGDLHHYLGVDAARSRVIPLGVSSSFVLDDDERAARAARARERFSLGARYFLYAGNHRPHKNLETLLDAWRHTIAPSDLLLTEDGNFGFPLDRGKKTNGRIVATGRVTKDELIDLYAGCSAAIQPSLYEGFGLGALEAMASGAPIIVARTPALLELTGGAALTFPAKDAPALAVLMDRLLADENAQRQLQSAGSKRAREFTWDNTARLTVEAYREVLQL